MADTDEIAVHRLIAARVFGVRSEPGNVVLKIETPTGTIHFGLSADELGELAKRLTQDSALLTAPPSGRGVQ